MPIEGVKLNFKANKTGTEYWKEQSFWGIEKCLLVAILGGGFAISVHEQFWIYVGASWLIMLLKLRRNFILLTFYWP